MVFTQCFSKFIFSPLQTTNIRYRQNIITTNLFISTISSWIDLTKCSRQFKYTPTPQMKISKTIGLIAPETFPYIRFQLSHTLSPQRQLEHIDTFDDRQCIRFAVQTLSNLFRTQYCSHTISSTLIGQSGVYAQRGILKSAQDIHTHIYFSRIIALMLYPRFRTSIQHINRPKDNEICNAESTSSWFSKLYTKPK